MLAAPWLVRRLLEGRVAPRALVLSYLLSMLAAGAATVALLFALMLRYTPHDMLVSVGLACQTADGCTTLLPGATEGVVAFGLGGVLVGLAVFAVMAGSAQLCATRRQHAVLAGRCRPWGGRSRGGLGDAVLVIEDPAPVSYTIGFLRPRVVISTGLLAALDDDEIEAVLAHEEGHVAGRDNLVALVARSAALTFVFLPGMKRALDRLRRAQELAADEFARRRMGDGLVVASSLQKFARALIVPVPSLGVVAGFADEGNVTERIRGLLRDDVVLPSRRYVTVGLVVLALVLTGFAGSAAAFSDVTVASASPCSLCHEAGHADDASPAGATGLAAAAETAVGSTCAH